MQGSVGEIDWPALLSEPQWHSSKFSAFTLQSRAVTLAPAGHARAAAYFALGEALRLAPVAANSVEVLEAAAYSYISAHVHRPDAAAYVNLGVVLQQAGRRRDAEAALRLAIHHRPESVAWIPTPMLI